MLRAILHGAHALMVIPWVAVVTPRRTALSMAARRSGACCAISCESASTDWRYATATKGYLARTSRHCLANSAFGASASCAYRALLPEGHSTIMRVTTASVTRGVVVRISISFAKDGGNHIRASCGRTERITLCSRDEYWKGPRRYYPCG